MKKSSPWSQVDWLPQAEPWIRNELERLGTPSTSVAIARELVEEVANCFGGVYFITPMMRYELTVELTRWVRQSSGSR